MKIKSIYLAFFTLLVFVFSSCGETKDEQGVYYNWQPRNIAVIDSISAVFDAGTDPDLFAIRGSRGNYTGNNLQVVDRYMEIYYKKYGNFYTDEDSTWDKAYAERINQANKDKNPIQTSEISCYYRGMLLIDESVIETAPKPGFITSAFRKLGVFDGNFGRNDKGIAIEPNPRPEFDTALLKGKVSDFVPGFTQMLQFMKPGDRVEVYIPYKYGYGKNGSGSIPATSNLYFDLTLVDITKY